MNLQAIQRKLFDEYLKNGYYKSWEEGGKKADIAELGLIVTEVSEAMEEVRNPVTDMRKLMLECADIIIRTLNFMSRKGCLAKEFILEKHEKNMKRGKLHGRAV